MKLYKNLRVTSIWWNGFLSVVTLMTLDPWFIDRVQKYAEISASHMRIFPKVVLISKWNRSENLFSAFIISFDSHSVVTSDGFLIFFLLFFFLPSLYLALLKPTLFFKVFSFWLLQYSAILIFFKTFILWFVFFFPT